MVNDRIYNLMSAHNKRLSEHPFWEDERLLSNMCLKRYRSKSEIISEGQQADKVYILLDGHIKVFSINMEGAVYIINDIKAPSFIGEYEVLGEINKYYGTVITISECYVAEWKKEDYLQYASMNTMFLRERTKEVIRDLSYKRREERHFLFLNSQERLISYLVKNYEKSQSDQKYVIERTQSEIAAEIGMCLKTVQRQISKAVDQGFIEQLRGRIEMSSEQIKMLQSAHAEILKNHEY